MALKKLVIAAIVVMVVLAVGTFTAWITGAFEKTVHSGARFV